MYKTEFEVFDQYNALMQTVEYMKSQADTIRAALREHAWDSIVYTGCGSSLSLCRSAALSAQLHLAKPASALAAGDLAINAPWYEPLLRRALVVAPSRSGSTTEVLRAAEKANALGRPVVAITAKDGSPLEDLADLTLPLPWAFDDSVCQTRTVTNLYAANLLLIAIIAGDNALVAEIEAMAAAGSEFMNRTKTTVQAIAGESWANVVVLGDGEVSGIAEEGSLAFVEICQIPGAFHHVLDVRHGPMVLINESTLVIAACSSAAPPWQEELIRDLRAKGARVVVVSPEPARSWGADWEVETPAVRSWAVFGIPFIFVPQAVALEKAKMTGVNPDEPTGLDPFIDLTP